MYLVLKDPYKLMWVLPRYTCDDESKLVGSTLIWCDGFQWNDTIPQCHSKFIMYLEFFKFFLLLVLLLYLLEIEQSLSYIFSNFRRGICSLHAATD